MWGCEKSVWTADAREDSTMVRGHYVWGSSSTDRAQWAWRTLLTSPPCSPPHMNRSPHLWRSPGEQSGYGPLGFQIWRQDGHTTIKRWKGKLKHCVCMVIRFVHRSACVYYLPLGRSESSFLQRTVGTGSPWTAQWNSTLSSVSTTTLLGRFRKVGRSGGQQAAHINTLTLRSYIVWS